MGQLCIRSPLIKLLATTIGGHQNLRCGVCDHGDNDNVGSCGGGRVGGHVHGGGGDGRGSGQVGACGDGWM